MWMDINIHLKKKKNLRRISLRKASNQLLASFLKKDKISMMLGRPRFCSDKA